MSDFIMGMRYFGRGVGWIARRPGLWIFGIIPAAVTLVLYLAALIALGIYAGDLAELITPFADAWSFARGLRIVVALMIFASGLFLAMITYTAITLLIGDPFYEKIAISVEESQGGAPPDPGVPWWRQFPRSVADVLVIAIWAGMFSVAFLILGFIPVFGQTVVPVVSVCVMGFFLTGELTSVAMERRGLHRRQRYALLRQNRMLAAGFGVSAVVLFLIPLGAIMFMPAAVAGGTLLTRERLAVRYLT